MNSILQQIKYPTEYCLSFGFPKFMLAFIIPIHDIHCTRINVRKLIDSKTFHHIKSRFHICEIGIDNIMDTIVPDQRNLKTVSVCP